MPTGTDQANRGNPRRLPRWVPLASLVLLILPLLGVVSGQRTLFFRDVSNLHLPAKWSQAESWSRGEIPFLDLARAGGQPSLGNPNLLPLYPDNLVYLVSPNLWAFNAHYWLHFLLAPFACAWLGRSLGLDRASAWAMGMFYVSSGYFLSQLNFYNLVAVSALVPAFLAALLAAAREPVAAAGRLTTVAVFFGLLLLAGDPMLAALAVLVGAVLLGFDRCAARRWVVIGIALLVGVLLGLPQHLEFLRILPESYRSYIGYTAQGSLVGSWDPRQILEWFVPFAYGRPDQSFWGASFFGGDQPFFFSLYPGSLLIGCVLIAGRPQRRWHWLAWGAAILGVFVALGAHNPAMRWFVEATLQFTGGILRFPIKSWILVALAMSYMAALGWRRAFGSERRGWLTFGGLAAVHVGLVALLRSSAAEGLIAQWATAARGSRRAAMVVEQWNHGITWAACGALFFLVATWFAWRSRAPKRWPEATLLVHVGLQMVLLAPLLVTDDADYYAQPTPLLQALEREPTLSQDTAPAVPQSVVQGNQFGAFGAPRSTVRFPDQRALWVQRRGAAELFPFAGVRWGLHYEMNVTADGLDHFASHLSLTALRGLDDAQRIQLLRAWSVDWLVLDRELDAAVETRFARRVAALEHFNFTTSVYELGERAPAALVATSIERGETVGEVRIALLRESFDPRRAVVLLGDDHLDRLGRSSVATSDASAASAAPAPGRVLSYRESADVDVAVSLEVEAPAPAVVQLARAYQPHYRVWVDGEPRRTLISNLSRLAVAVEAGHHRVEFRLHRPHRWVWWSITLLTWSVCLTLLLRSAARQLAGAREESTPRT